MQECPISFLNETHNIWMRKNSITTNASPFSNGQLFSINDWEVTPKDYINIIY